MLYIERDSKTPIYEQIYSELVREILSGKLAAGDRLSSTRGLAGELSVGRNTVDRAYQQLVAEGYIQPKTGSGFTVNRIPLDFGNEAKAAAQETARDGGMTEDKQNDRAGTEGAKTKEVRYDFAYGSMDNSLFPYNLWRRSLNNVLAEMEMTDVIPYPARAGEPRLRREIARYLFRSRGVECDPEQMVITCGQQHSMEMIANMFENTGKRFAMEEPGYDGIRAVFANHHYRLSAVPVDKDGISPNLLKGLDTDLLYLTPSHQFPTGAILPIGRRRRLLQWAEETDTYLIEDDYDSELRYYTDPIPSMQSLDIHQRTIYTGTFSKSLAPSMRIAYIVFPPSLLERYREYYQRYNSQVAPLHQLVLADFIGTGNYERHINRLRTAYRKKQEALLAAIEQVFRDRISVSGGGAGIHLLLDVRGSLSQDELIARAENAGIRLYPTAPLYMDVKRCPKGRLMLGFPTIPEDDFVDIMTDLRRAWDM